MDNQRALMCRRGFLMTSGGVATLSLASEITLADPAFPKPLGFSRLSSAE